MDRIRPKLSGKHQASEIIDENDVYSVLKARAAANTNQNNSKKRASSPTSKVEAKKLKISADEAHMNGAPEGDLYDVTVTEDANLPHLDDGSNSSCASNSNSNSNTIHVIEKQLRETLASVTDDSASWADRFTAVELVRRVTLSAKHRSIIIDDCVILLACLESCLHAVSSLRSCSVRNGLLALSALVRHIPAVMEKSESTLLVRCILKLVDTGPKFIVESATKLVLDTITGMDPLVAIAALAPTTQHKSAQVSNLSCELLGDCVLRFDRAYLGLSENKTVEDDEEEEEEEEEEGEEARGEALLAVELEAEARTRYVDEDDDEDDGETSVILDSHMDVVVPTTNASSSSSSKRRCSALSGSGSGSGSGCGELSTLHSTIQLLHRGLSAKKPTGREACRRALHYLQKILGEVVLHRLAQHACTEVEVIDIHREINRYAASYSCSASSFPSPSPSLSLSLSSSASLSKGQQVSPYLYMHPSASPSPAVSVSATATDSSRSSRRAGGAGAGAGAGEKGAFERGFSIQGQGLLLSATVSSATSSSSSSLLLETPKERKLPRQSHSTSHSRSKDVHMNASFSAGRGGTGTIGVGGARLVPDRASSTGKLSVREQMQQHRLQHRMSISRDENASVIANSSKNAASLSLTSSSSGIGAGVFIFEDM